MKRRRMLLFAWFCSMLTCARMNGEIVDRLAIAVGREVITQLQLDEELRVTALLNHQPVVRDLDARRSAADRLVDQLLIKHEMEVSHYPLPNEKDVGKYLDAIRKEQGGADVLDAALRSNQISESALKQHLAWQLTTLRFVDYRFASDTAVSDAEIENAYRREIANWKDTHKESPASLDAVKERIRQELSADRTDVSLNTWLAETRKQINIVYLDKTLQ